MESGPLALAGTAFALFGAALLVWTAARARQGRPVADGVDPATATVLASLFGVAFLLTGAWILLVL